MKNSAGAVEDSFDFGLLQVTYSFRWGCIASLTSAMMMTMAAMLMRIILEDQELARLLIAVSLGLGIFFLPRRGRWDELIWEVRKAMAGFPPPP